MLCSYYQELISRMLDEDLTPVEQNVLLAHLPNCEACSAMYKSFSALSKALEDQLEEPPESLRYNVMAELRREDLRRKNRLSRPVKILLSTAACLALIVGITMGSGVLRPKGAAAPASQNTVLAGSSFTASSRSMPAEETAAEADEALPYEAAKTIQSAASAAEAQADSVMDAAEAPAAAYAAEESAAGAISNAMAAESDSGAAAFDLSDRLTKDELLHFLEGTHVDLAAMPEHLLYQVITADGDGYATLTFYEQDGELFYSLPDRGTYLAQCSPAALEAFLAK